MNDEMLPCEEFKVAGSTDFALIFFGWPSSFRPAVCKRACVVRVDEPIEHLVGKPGTDLAECLG